MERPNLDYFMCKSCTNPIASGQHFQRFYYACGRYGCLFNLVVNVQEGDHNSNIHPHTLAPIYCVNCGENLGYKYVRVPSWWPGYFRSGMVILYINKVSRWCGEEILSGHTLLGHIIRNLRLEDVSFERSGNFVARIRH